MDRQVNNQNIILLSIGVWFIIISRCMNSCQAAGLVCNSNSSLPSIWIRNRCQNRLVKNNAAVFDDFFLFSHQFISVKNPENSASVIWQGCSLSSFASDCFIEKIWKIMLSFDKFFSSFFTSDNSFEKVKTSKILLSFNKFSLFFFSFNEKLRISFDEFFLFFSAIR